ncbi:hypothetical protein ARMSODRAFT_978982 [Armillaria solidipes]|uniref:Uncharacterized protein n=1 Tax=Armillaria solidipes TaxID=1076256 RepID=A0A2H3BFD2_9AGAR|nr:hypothetical protein ARMSODRAFT_978982 [Armillaria solidipes]
MITGLFAAYGSTSPGLCVYAVSLSRLEAPVLRMESKYSLTGNDTGTGFCSMQESKEQLPCALKDRINDDTYAISDDGGRAWQSLLYSQWISLYPDTVQSLQAHVEEQMDYEGSGLAQDVYALEQYMVQMCGTQQALEGGQDELSMDTERVTVEGSVSDESDGTVDSSMTAQIRCWKALVSETTDGVVDKDFERRLSLVVELKEQ